MLLVNHSFNLNCRANVDETWAPLLSAEDRDMIRLKALEQTLKGPRGEIEIEIVINYNYLHY